MNLPNKLTVLRLILTFVFLAAMTLEFPFSKTAALLIFAIAAITDFFDGYLARKYDLITNFGKLMDPLADKVLMTGGFVMLAASGWIPAWIIVVILAREFMVTGLRLVASAEGVVLAAENLGKYKTTIQIVTVLYFLVLLAAQEWFKLNITGTAAAIGHVLVWGSLILTLLSGFNYMWKNRQLLSDC